MTATNAFRTAVEGKAAEIFAQFPMLRGAVPPERVTYFVEHADPRELFAPVAALVRKEAFRLRLPAESPDGLAGPFLGRGDCLEPLMPSSGIVLQWFDPAVPARDGDIVLVEHDVDFLFDLVERGREVPGWIETYGEHPCPVACKQLRHTAWHHLLLTNTSSAWLGKHRILGVLRYCEIDGRPMYGSGPAKGQRVMSEPPISHQVNYLSGSSVESLEPAEAAADVTAPRLLGNSMINGGFETGTSEGWIEDADWSLDATSQIDGTYSARITEGTTGLRAALINNPSASNNDRFILTVVAKRDESDLPDSDLTIMVRNQPGGNPNFFLQTESIDKDIAGRQFARVIVTVNDDEDPIEAVQPVIRKTGGSSGAWFVDSIFFAPIPRGADIILNDASGEVSTIQISDEAVTVISAVRNSSVSLVSGGGVVDDIVIPAIGLDYKLIITASFNVWITNDGGGTPEFYCQMLASQSSTQVLGEEAIPSATVSPGERITLQLETDITPAIEDGQSLLAQIVWTGAQPGGTAEVRNLTIRAEAIKR